MMLIIRTFVLNQKSSDSLDKIAAELKIDANEALWRALKLLDYAHSLVENQKMDEKTDPLIKEKRGKKSK